MRLARPAFAALAALAGVLALGCPKTTPDRAAGADASATGASGGAGGTAATRGDASRSASGDGGAAAANGGAEDVEPVYPIEANAPALPLAEKLCNALTTLPEKRRAECCNAKPSIVITAECTRQLSAALRHGALALEEKDVDACIAAFDKTLEGCDWVGPFPPGPPPACQGIFKGKLAAGQRCRSSLECTGDLRCKDLGPTSPGRCVPAGGSEATSCGGTVDSLATYTRQNDVDRRHPECRDRCIKHKCQKPVDEGGACLISADCQEGMQCLPAAGPLQKNGQPPRKCVAGKAPSKEGEPCPGDVCEGTLQCIRGKCTNKKAGGEACTDDFECRGGCLRDGGASGKGTCGPRCDIR
jgi:hypothetical protein